MKNIRGIFCTVLFLVLHIDLLNANTAVTVFGDITKVYKELEQFEYSPSVADSLRDTITMVEVGLAVGILEGFLNAWSLDTFANLKEDAKLIVLGALQGCFAGSIYGLVGRMGSKPTSKIFLLTLGLITHHILVLVTSFSIRKLQLILGDNGDSRALFLSSLLSHVLGAVFLVVEAFIINNQRSQLDSERNELTTKLRQLATEADRSMNCLLRKNN